MNKSNGTSIVLIQWHRGHKKCYFSIIPTMLWQEFRTVDARHYAMYELDSMSRSYEEGWSKLGLNDFSVEWQITSIIFLLEFNFPFSVAIR